MQVEPQALHLLRIQFERDAWSVSVCSCPFLVRIKFALADALNAVPA